MKKLQPKSIPAELKTLRHWAGWRLQPREGGKMAKIPISPKTGVFARTNIPRLWGSFEEAIHACEARKWGCAGIGFLFSRNDQYVGIDLDHCRDPKTGSMEPWAQKIIDDARSYTEISPSGTGVHIIVKVKEKPPGLNKRDFGGIEIFVASVYMTFTGDHLPGTPRDIAFRDGVVKNLIVTHTREKSQITTRRKPPVRSNPQTRSQDLEAPNLNKFHRLYAGDCRSGYSSQSEADLALCSILASLTGSNPSLIDQLFRNSRLFREKWDQKHFASGKTYGEATIDKAIRTRRFTKTKKRKTNP